MKSFKTTASLPLLILLIIMSCTVIKNPVLNYFKNAELQYEGKIQEENIVNALKDIINLSEKQLQNKMYPDYTGRKNQWDLQTLIYKYFVPEKKDKTLGLNFYHDVKLKNVQKEVKQILIKIEQAQNNDLKN